VVDWLDDFMDMLFMDNWLMEFMNDGLMSFMDDLSVDFFDHILMMLMDHFLVSFFNNWSLFMNPHDWFILMLNYFHLLEIFVDHSWL